MLHEHTRRPGLKPGCFCPLIFSRNRLPYMGPCHPCVSPGLKNRNLTTLEEIIATWRSECIMSILIDTCQHPNHGSIFQTSESFRHGFEAIGKWFCVFYSLFKTISIFGTSEPWNNLLKISIVHNNRNRKRDTWSQQALHHREPVHREFSQRRIHQGIGRFRLARCGDQKG